MSASFDRLTREKATRGPPELPWSLLLTMMMMAQGGMSTS
jgi:hypothetical protein